MARKTHGSEHNSIVTYLPETEFDYHIVFYKLQQASAQLSMRSTPHDGHDKQGISAELQPYTRVIATATNMEAKGPLLSSG